MSFYSDFKIGMLGGGQLGRMLIQAGIDLNLEFSVMDPDPEAPCSKFAKNFVQGDLTDFQNVYEFGQGKDLITIEIENVNVEALEKLESEGVKVYPQPGVIKIIQDKRKQKQFYKDNHIPTSDFVLVDSKSDLHSFKDFFPAFQKLGKAGYDGRGVCRLKNESDIPSALEGSSVLEKLVDFEKEISVLVARNTDGQIVTFPVVEMVFNPVYNLVEYLFSPAQITSEQENKAKSIASEIISKFKMVGLLAVEMFIDKEGKVLVNEVAPRPHNSGHQTIKANYTSQYEQHLRAILGLPLGTTVLKRPTAMINLLGEPNFEGKAKYEGINEVMAEEGVYLHLYGKVYTKPFRKMGHVTILDEDVEGLKKKVLFVKNKLKVKA